MERVSFWLMPARPDWPALEDLIRNLARRFDAPIFDPHVTIHSGQFRSRAVVTEIVRRVARQHAALTLHTKGLAHSGQFTKALFIECQSGGALSAISDAVKEESAGEDYELRPHVSLLYADIAAPVRQELVEELCVPSLLHFDAIRAVLTGPRTTSRRDVESWRTIAEFPLAAR